MSFYKILRANPNASEQEITYAAERMKRIWHPLQFDAAYRKISQTVFDNIQSAERTLADPVKRILYDKNRKYSGLKSKERDESSVCTGFGQSINQERSGISHGKFGNKRTTPKNTNGNYSRIIPSYSSSDKTHFVDSSLTKNATSTYFSNGNKQRYQARQSLHGYPVHQGSLSAETSTCPKRQSVHGRNTDCQRNAERFKNSLKKNQVKMFSSSEGFLVQESILDTSLSFEREDPEQRKIPEKSTSCDSNSKIVPQKHFSNSSLTRENNNIFSTLSDAAHTIEPIDDGYLDNTEFMDKSDRVIRESKVQAISINQHKFDNSQRGNAKASRIFDDTKTSDNDKSRRSSQGYRASNKPPNAVYGCIESQLYPIPDSGSIIFKVSKKPKNKSHSEQNMHKNYQPKPFSSLHDLYYVDGKEKGDAFNLDENMANKSDKVESKRSTKSLQEIPDTVSNRNSRAENEGIRIDIDVKQRNSNIEDGRECRKNLSAKSFSERLRNITSENTDKIITSYHRNHVSSTTLKPDIDHLLEFERNKNISEFSKDSVHLSNAKQSGENFHVTSLEQFFEIESRDNSSKDGCNNGLKVIDCINRLKGGGGENYLKDIGIAKGPKSGCRKYYKHADCLKHFKGGCGNDTDDIDCTMRLKGGCENDSDDIDISKGSKSDCSSDDSKDFDLVEGYETENSQPLEDITTLNICNTKAKQVKDGCTLRCKSFLQIYARRNADISQLNAKVRTTYSEDLTWKKIVSATSLKCLEMVAIYKFRDSEEILKVSLEGKLAFKIVNDFPQDIATEYWQPSGGISVPLTMTTRLRANNVILEIIRTREQNTEMIEVVKNGMILYRLESQFEQ